MNKIVCHITSAHPASDIRIFHKECLTIAEDGFTVHLVAKGSLPENETRVIHHELPTQPNRSRLSRMLFKTWQAYKMAQSTQADLFHFHDPELLPYGLLLKWQGHAVIYDAHEDLPRDVLIKSWIPKILRQPVSWLIERFEHFVARRIDGVVAATPYIGDRFRRIGAKVIVVKNYPRLGELVIENHYELLANQVPAVCYIGLISPERGIVELIQATEKLDVKLIMAGSFNNEQTEHLVRSLPGWSKVDYRGTLARDGVAQVCAESTIGICTLYSNLSHDESLPIKLFEYMSAGLPVLASNIPLWVDIIEKSHCGLCVDPKNVEQIQLALQWMLDHPSEIQQMGQNGKRAAEEHYNWNTESRSLLNFYRELVAVDNSILQGRSPAA